MSTYPYPFTAFSNSGGQVDNDSLFSVVSHDASISQTLTSVTQTPTLSPDTVVFTFAADLSSDEQATLDGDVSNYQYASYAFSMADDFKAGTTQIDFQDFTNIINNDAAVGQQVSGWTQLTSDEIVLVFSTALTSPQQTALDADVANYVFVAFSSDNVVGISEVQAPGTNGGTFTAGAWQPRNINFISSIVRWLSLNAGLNEFTLKASPTNPASFLVSGVCPARGVGAHQARLQNMTAGTSVVSGTADYSSTDTTHSTFSKRVTLSANTTYQVQHYCQTTVADTGLGSAGGFPGTLNELYSLINVQAF